MRKPEWQNEGSMDQARRRATINALQQCDQNVARAAKRLQIGRSTMYRLLAKFELRVVEGGMENVPRERHPGTVTDVQDRSSDARARQQGKLVQVDDQLFLVS
jgi:transposase